MNDVIFYQNNGISVNDPKDIKTSFYIQENLKQDNFDSRFFYAGDSINYELDRICVDLYDVFTRKIFVDIKDYYRHIDYLPYIVMKAGLDSDCNLSKEQFQQFIEQDLGMSQLAVYKNDETKVIYAFLEKHKYQYLYLSDCQALINSVQELLQTCRSNFVFFYKLLCEIDGPKDFCDDYYAISSEGRIVISIASNIFISLYSIFDILAQLAYELENIKDCSENYSKLASSKKLFGDRKHLQTVNIKGTVFEKNRTISIIENLRNELVHNAVWEMNSKIFFRIKDEVIIDKTIYFPDFSEDGHLETYKNHKRFFSKGIKLNEILPTIYFDALQKIKVTLERLVEIN